MASQAGDFYHHLSSPVERKENSEFRVRFVTSFPTCYVILGESLNYKSPIYTTHKVKQNHSPRLSFENSIYDIGNIIIFFILQGKLRGGKKNISSRSVNR